MQVEIDKLRFQVKFLFVVVFLLLLLTGFFGYQIMRLQEKIPDYQELKKDVEFVKDYYDSTKNKVIDYSGKVKNFLKKDDEN